MKRILYGSIFRSFSACGINPPHADVYSGNKGKQAVTFLWKEYANQYMYSPVFEGHRKMKRLFQKFFLIFFLMGPLSFNSVPLFSSIVATSIENDIDHDTIWLAANSPYEITGDIKVCEGVTLTIKPGVVVNFDDNTALIVEGSLIAIGTNSSRITFTSNQTNPARGQWTNIRFVGGSSESFLLKFADVTYARRGIVIESSGDALIEQCEVANNSLSGIHVIGEGKVTIKDNLIRLNGYGIKTEGQNSSNIKIVGNIILSNDEDGVYISSSNADVCRIFNVTVSDNYISRNGNGIYMFSNAGVEKKEAHISGVTISNNFIPFNHYGIRLQTNAWYYGYIYDSTIYNNTLILNEEGINIRSGSNWYSWIANITISGNKALANKNGISLYGFRIGAPLDPFYYLPFDATIVGNTISGNTNKGISILGDVRANLTGNSVAYNSYGINITSKDNLARKNDIYGNTLYGMYVMVANPAVNAQIDAEDNFWGHSTGPFHESLNPDGQGDRVNGNGENLDFNPFLSAPLGYMNEAPVAKLMVSEATTYVNETVTFDGFSSEDDLLIALYFFDFGDGENSGWVEAPSVSHQYVSEGVYEVSLIVMDFLGVKSDIAVETVTVTIRLLGPSVFLNPMAVFSQGEVLVEVSVTDEEAVGVEDAFVQLASDKGGTFNPAFGYTDTNGSFSSTFFAPEVSESTGVGITVTVSKEGYKGGSDSVYLSVLKTPSDRTGFDLSWVWPVATLAVVAVALVIFVKRRKSLRRFAKRK